MIFKYQIKSLGLQLFKIKNGHDIVKYIDKKFKLAVIINFQSGHFF